MWATIKSWFLDSETIVVARIQVLFGVLMATDLSPVLPAKYLPWYIVASGVITEMARRARDPDLGKE